MHNVHRIVRGSRVLVFLQDASLVSCRLHPLICNAISSTWQLKLRISGVKSIKLYPASCCCQGHGAVVWVVTVILLVLASFFFFFLRRRTRVAVIFRIFTEMQLAFERRGIMERLLDTFSKILRDMKPPPGIYICTKNFQIPCSSNADLFQDRVFQIR